MSQGQLDPMAVDKMGFAPLHYFRGSIETLEYIINQQEYFDIDLNQNTENNDSFATRLLAAHLVYREPHGLHLIRYLWDRGLIQSCEISIRALLILLSRLVMEMPSGSNPSIAELTGMDDMEIWLADLICMIYRQEILMCLPLLLSYCCLVYEDPAAFVENDKTRLIRLWLAILQEANIDLHEHFRNLEKYLDQCGLYQNRVLDFLYHRKGIERTIEIEYGTDSSDVTILVRDTRVEIPPEDCIPGAWNTSETMSRTGRITKGLEPTANWRVSTKEDWNALRRQVCSSQPLWS